MFNRSAFNDLRYNQPNLHVTLSAEFGGTAAVSASTTTNMTGSARISAHGELAARTLIVQSLRVYISSQGSLRAKMLRIASVSSRLHAKGSLLATARRYQVRTLTYTGSFAPKQIIVIHARRMSIKVDGQDASHLMQGQFGRIGSGVNEMVYSDSGIQREVAMQIEHKDTNL